MAESSSGGSRGRCWRLSYQRLYHWILSWMSGNFTRAYVYRPPKDAPITLYEQEWTPACAHGQIHETSARVNSGQMHLWHVSQGFGNVGWSASFSCLTNLANRNLRRKVLRFKSELRSRCESALLPLSIATLEWWTLCLLKWPPPHYGLHSHESCIPTPTPNPHKSPVGLSTNMCTLQECSSTRCLECTVCIPRIGYVTNSLQCLLPCDNSISLVRLIATMAPSIISESMSNSLFPDLSRSPQTYVTLISTHIQSLPLTNEFWSESWLTNFVSQPESFGCHFDLWHSWR